MPPPMIAARATRISQGGIVLTLAPRRAFLSARRCSVSRRARSFRPSARLTIFRSLEFWLMRSIRPGLADAELVELELLLDLVPRDPVEHARVGSDIGTNAADSDHERQLDHKRDIAAGGLVLLVERLDPLVL